MTWQHWIITGFLVMTMLGQFSMVDKPRETKTTADAIGGSLANIILIMLLVWGNT